VHIRMQMTYFGPIFLTHLQLHGTLCVLNERSACTGSRKQQPRRPERTGTGTSKAGGT